MRVLEAAGAGVALPSTAGGAGCCGALAAHAGLAEDAHRMAEAQHLVAAPGVCIRSTWPHGRYNTISGTSMATPHVSAVVALCLSSGRCHGASADVARQVRADAQAHATGANGFAGDPRHPVTGRIYGDLVWAGGY